MKEQDFPGFKPLELNDRRTISDLLALAPPLVSELTFTNLFIWRLHYRPVWRIYNDCLLVVMQGEAPFALPPAGPGDKTAAVYFLFKQMSDSGTPPIIARAGQDLSASLAERPDILILPDPDQNDYVYLTRDLIELAGRKYHQKKNHLNWFLKNYDYEKRPIDESIIPELLSMQEDWCRLKECGADPGLHQEDQAVYEALSNFDSLNCLGLAVLIDSKVQAFTLGETLNTDTAVIHIEKANPEIRGLQAAINQFFCQEAWSGVKFINREQDLGLEGLRKAKESYRPHHMVEKFIIRPR